MVLMPEPTVQRLLSAVQRAVRSRVRHGPVLHFVHQGRSAELAYGCRGPSFGRSSPPPPIPVHLRRRRRLVCDVYNTLRLWMITFAFAGCMCLHARTHFRTDGRRRDHVLWHARSATMRAGSTDGGSPLSTASVSSCSAPAPTIGGCAPSNATAFVSSHFHASSTRAATFCSSNGATSRPVCFPIHLFDYTNP